MAVRNKAFSARMAVGLLFVLLLMACQRQETMMQYEPTDIAAWASTELLDYSVEPLSQGGNYEMRVHVRTTPVDAYPFKVLYLEVRQQWSSDSVALVDTIACDFNDYPEQTTGVSLHQYSYPVSVRHCEQGDSAKIVVRHLMRSDEISGITDVGISLLPR